MIHLTIEPVSVPDPQPQVFEATSGHRLFRAERYSALLDDTDNRVAWYRSGPALTQAGAPHGAGWQETVRVPAADVPPLVRAEALNQAVVQVTRASERLADYLDAMTSSIGGAE